MKADLEDRIADAFSTQLSSKALGELLKEVGLTDIAAREASRLASERALDPTIRPADVAAARQEMADADFRSQRLAIASERLSELHGEAKKREEAAEREEESKATFAERDVLAKDLEEYDDLSRKIVDLLMRLRASNNRVGANQSAEVIARRAGVNWPVQVDVALPRLLDGTRLPKFRRDGTNQGYLWPKQ